MMDWEELVCEFSAMDMNLAFSYDKRSFNICFKGNTKCSAIGGHIHPSVLFFILQENLEKAKALKQVRKTFNGSELLATLVGGGRFPVDDLFHVDLSK
jgi:hypothetical protein